MSAPRPANERERLAALRDLEVLDTQPEQALDELVSLAAQIFEVPIALVSLVDEDRQWFKSRLGIEISETSRDFSFCAHAILQHSVFEVEDATADERFTSNPFVTGDPGVRFYAAAPLATERGYKLGTLCVIDRRPRRLSQRQKEILVVLARAVSAQLELRSALERAQSEAVERAKIESRLRRTTSVLRAMHEVQSQVLEGLHLPAAFQRILEALLDLTESEYGFVGEILTDPEGQPYLKTHAITDIAWNEDTRRFYDESAPMGMEFRNLRTLFGAVMTSGASVVANDPASDPRRGGLPPGHPPLNCFLGVPFSSGPRPSGMIGVANAPAGYDDSVIEMLEPLLGACAAMVGFARLERARRVAETALRESEERFRLVLEDSLDAVVGIDSLGYVRTWNRQAERIFGWSEEEATGQDLSELIVPPRFREAHRRGLERYLATEESQVIGRRVELAALRREGEEFPIELTVSAIRSEAGMSFSAFIRDIGDRQRAEDELRGTTSRLVALIQNLGAGLLVEDENRRIILANEELCRIFAIESPPEAMVGLDCAESAAGLAELFEDPKGFLGTINAALAARVLVHGHELHLRNGRILEQDYIPIFANESYLGHMWQYRDVTERKRAERELLERGNALSAANAELSRASRLKDEFLASMSHELRTPLNAVLGLSEGLRAGVFEPLSAHQSEQVTMIEDSGRHLLELINDVLDLSKVEAGKLELAPETVAVDDVCQASLRMIKEIAHKKQLRVATSLDGGLVSVEADARRLKQILVNLLSNAVKFTLTGGSIGLETRLDRDAGEAEFVVWDTGIGIEREDLPRLFRPFVQLDSSLARKHSGTGLGLSLVRQLAELHGGGVGVESSPGEGSRFTVTLPVQHSTGIAPDDSGADLGEQPDEKPTSSPDSPTVSPPQGPLVLLAEDHEINVKTLSAFLASRGFRVAVARNGREAVERSHEEHPAVILMDIQMPGMDGLAAIRELRNDETTSQIPIIALTALAMAGDRERCLEAGANEYMSKPVRLRELVRLVRGFTTAKLA